MSLVRALQTRVDMRTTLVLALAALLGIGTLGCAAQEEGDDVTCDGKCDGFNVQYSEDIPHIVAKDVHNYLEEYGWGDYHLVFHMSRRWFLAGDQTRQWLDSLHEQYADLQEGDPGGGVEFLAMHRAMIEHLDEKFGELNLSTRVRDGAGFSTMHDVFVGWDTDDKIIEQIERVGGDVTKFRAAAAKVRDWDSWASEEDFGSYLQTTLRLSRMVDENNTEKRFYDQDSTAGAGIHNSLHGMFSDGSQVDVGDPQRNLSNQQFWGIHGWVEARWKEFETHHTRTTEEQEAFDHQMERFRLHMQLHSDFHEEHQNDIPKATPAVHDAVIQGDRAFRNGANCDDLDSTVEMPDCT